MLVESIQNILTIKLVANSLTIAVHTITIHLVSGPGHLKFTVGGQGMSNRAILHFS
jgi:hypothetical protein